MWLVYVLLGNIILNTPAGEGLINRRPDAFKLAWTRAMTLWPGHAMFWNVTARGHVRRIVWHAAAGRASGRVSLVALVGRTLALPAVTADDVHVVLERVDDDRLPPPPRPGGWTLRFDTIQTDTLRGLRMDAWRLEGDGSARLALVKQLRGGPLEIMPSTLRMRKASGFDDDLQWLDAGEIDAQFRLPPSSQADGHGLARLMGTIASLSVTGRVPTLRVALDGQGHWDADVSGFQASDSTSGTVPTAGAPAATEPPADDGQLRIDLAIDDGQLQPGGVVDLSIPLRAADADGAAWRGNAGVKVTVDENIRLGMHLPPPPGDQGHVDASLIVAGRTIPVDADWHALSKRVSGTIDLRWHFDSLHWFAPMFARVPWLDMDGAGEVDATLAIADGALGEGSRLEIPGIDVAVDVLDNRFTGVAHATGSIEGSGDARRTRLALTVDRFSMSPHDAPREVHARGQALTLDLVADGALARLRESLTAHLRFAGAEAPDLTVYNRYLPHEGVRFMEGRGRVGADLHIDAAGEVGHGRIDVATRDARMVLGDLDVSGDLSIAAQLRRADLAARRFDLGGSTIDLTRFRAGDRDRSGDDDWWAHATLDSGHVIWGRPLAVDARVSARAKNAALLLSLFAHKRDYPRWVFGLVDAGEARVDSRVLMDGGGLVLDPMHARNDRFDVKARLRLAGRQPLGDLLVAWRRLSVALEIGRGEKHWHLRKAAEWFAGRTLPR
jgi:hypothetical protein